MQRLAASQRALGCPQAKPSFPRLHQTVRAGLLSASCGPTAAAVPSKAAALLHTQFGGRTLLRPASNRCSGRRAARCMQRVSAMVNVDISPSVVLGVGLIGAGVSLWQIRRVKPWISKDYDVVVSCISLLVGGILIFQGWRLDPLLLFGQLMTTGAAVSFAVEALRLRSEQYEGEEKAALQDVYQRKRGGGRDEAGAFQLPPPEAGSQQPWAASQPWQQQQQQQQQQGAAFYDPQQPGSDYQGQQQQQYGSASDGQWYYGSGSGQYQVADYEVPPQGPADSAAPFGGGRADGWSDADSAGPSPSEFVFPASYTDDSASSAGREGSNSSDWGSFGSEQQQGQQGKGQRWGAGPPQPGRSSGYDMDDW